MSQLKLPTLYKKTSSGAIQMWQIWTEDNIIKTAFGQLGGKIQQTEDIIYVGKNSGRANATTPVEQAELEAKAHWEKKKKKSYVEEVERAELEETDIRGGLDVMLAHTYSKHGHKIIWPAYIQPKFDGIRMVAIVDDGVCTLWTRTRKPIVGIPHIQRELEQLFPHGYHTFDGECYNHEFKHDFEKIVSYVRQEEPIDGHEAVQYHIYDILNEKPFEERLNELYHKIPAAGLIFGTCASVPKYIKITPTEWVVNEEDAMEKFETFKKLGYEGAILRNRSGLYVGKRSYDLQKIKEFDDAEFEILDIEEGRGKLMGHVGAFVCETSGGKKFKAKMMGEIDKLKEYFDKPELWRGQKLTVKYQGFTNKEGVPRFPVGVIIRNYE